MSEEYAPKHVCLFSGGHDSLVATHHCMEEGLTEKVLHIDTGIGIPETQEFVRQVCEDQGWDLEIISSEADYEEIVKEHGFPGGGAHGLMYIRLKDRALQAYSTRTDGKPHFYTGIRKDESDRRMRTTSDSKVEEAKQYVWHSPILYWSEEDCREYMEEHDLPRSPVKQTYHHSGECLCGAFANRQEELLILEAHYPETADRIKRLEEEVRERHGGQNDRSYWGHQDMDDPDLRGLKAEKDDQQDTLDLKLCRDCSRNYPSPEEDQDE